MLLLATMPRSLKFSVNAPGEAGSSLVTIERGRTGADWADAAAASPIRAAQAVVVQRPVRAACCFPFGLMIIGPLVLCPGDGFRRSPSACRARSGHDLNRICRRADRPNTSLERAGRDGTSV